MDHCHFDHSIDDVRKKFESQVEFLQKETQEQFQGFFQKDHSQDILNEIFHLLKKYDLVDEGEKETRNKRMLLIIQNV